MVSATGGAGVDELDPAQQVVRDGGKHSPGAVGVGASRRAVSSPAPALKSRMASLTTAVGAVVGFGTGGAARAVGDEGVVAPVGEQLGLGAEDRVRRTTRRCLSP